MIASRTAARAATRTLRAPIRSNAQHARFASTDSVGVGAGKKVFSDGVLGGLAGGGLVFLAGYGYYHISGAKSIIDAASATKNQFTKVTKDLQAKTPEPNEAIQWLKKTAHFYATFIPGGKSVVDSAFNDLERVQEKHGDEVNAMVTKTYNDLKDATKNGMSLETVSRSWDVLESAMKQLGELANDSAMDIMDNHPQLKENVGGSLDQLKSMTDSYGPEAKKELEETYQQIKDAVKGGVSLESVNKVRKLIQDKTEKIKKMGDEAWEKGLEQARPYFDKNPQVKEIVESNAETLKQGNTGEVFQKVKDAVSSGNTEELQDYVKSVGEKAK